MEFTVYLIETDTRYIDSFSLFVKVKNENNLDRDRVQLNKIISKCTFKTLHLKIKHEYRFVAAVKLLIKCSSRT